MKNLMHKENLKSKLFAVVAAFLLGTVALANAQVSTMPVNGTLLVLTSPDPVNNPTAPAGIVQITRKTGTQSILSSGGLFVFPTDIRETADDTLYVADQNAQTTGAVIAVDPSNGAQTLIASGGYLLAPQAIQNLNNGHLVVSNCPLAVGSNAPPSLVEIDPKTGEQTLITQGGSLFFPNGLQPGPGDTIYVNDVYAPAGIGGIYQVNLHTGAQTLISAGNLLYYPDAIITDSKGNLVVYNYGLSSIVRVNPKTGSQQMVSQGGLLSNGNGIRASRGGDIFVSELQTPASVVEVEPSGAQSILSTGNLLDTVYNLLVFYHNKPGVN